MYPIFDKKLRRKSATSIGEPYRKKCDENWEWYDPPEKSLPVLFCLETSLHGLKYIGQSGRHSCERIFWFSAFTASLIASMVLIWGLYQVYRDVPIITVFNPTEISMDQIPFPGVTVCNVNNIRKRKVEEYKSKAIKGINKELPEETLLRTFATLLDINHICTSATTFTERFFNETDFVFKDLLDEDTRYVMRARHSDFKQYSNPRKTLDEGSQSCKEMILFCLWLDERVNCSDIFQGIDTDYGYCCTFNTIPLSLLMKQSNDPTDDPERVKAWEKEDLTTDNLLFWTKADSRRQYPRRQLYPGRPAGLSILLDPDLDEYYCSNTGDARIGENSEGFVTNLNLPLDFPRMKDNGIAVPKGSEVFISVRPSVTLSAETITDFDLEHRQCYFGKEWELPHYSKYTTSNCMDECIANQTWRECNCVRYYMPGGYVRDRLCEPRSYNCTEAVRKKVIQKGMEKACKTCLPPCTEIEYTAETTSLPIREEAVDKLFNQSGLPRPRHASIMHVYINVDSVFPRLRKEFTTKTELLSNAGGLLGLCMGFSVLSLLEIIYYCSMRVACRYYRSQSTDDESTVTSEIEQNSQQQETTIDLNNIPMNKKQRNSWFRKIFAAPVTFVEEDPTLGKKASGRKQSPILPEYFKEPFEADFSKASVIANNNYYNWAV